MAERYVQAATQQLAPAYDQQATALQSKVPAIQQLYQSLMQGLQGQQSAGNLNILEGAGGRGLLRSTIPVDAQTQLGQSIVQQQGQYASQQAKELGDVQSQIAGLGVDRAGAISNLANALRQTAISKQQFEFQKKQSNKDFALQKKLAAQQYQLALAAARRF